MSIDAWIKGAMKEQNKEMLLAYRAVKAKMLLEKTKEKPSELGDEELLKQALQKEIKERKEANSLFKDTQHPEFLQNQKMIEGLQKHLPKALSQEEQNALIDQLIAAIKPEGPADLKKVMQALMPHKDVVDLKEASARISSLLKR